MRAPFVGNNPKYFREWIFSFFIFNQSTRRAPYRFKQIPQTLEKPFTDVWRNALVRNGSTKPERFRSQARGAALSAPPRNRKITFYYLLLSRSLRNSQDYYPGPLFHAFPCKLYPSRFSSCGKEGMSISLLAERKLSRASCASFS